MEPRFDVIEVADNGRVMDKIVGPVVMSNALEVSRKCESKLPPRRKLWIVRPGTYRIGSFLESGNAPQTAL